MKKEKLLENFIIALAPMAGVTDFAFRKICADFGANMVVTEMISAKAFEHDSEKTRQMLFEEKHKAIKCVQLFGHDEFALQNIIKSGDLKAFDVIDFNCGCPAPKIVKNKEGSFLMTDIEKARKLILAIKSSTDKPVSVKFRLGFKEENYIEFGKMCEECKVDFITLHARTREQQYAGKVNKEAYKKLINSVNIPVMWSGDILTIEDMLYAKSIGCAGVMIARGALGNPEIFSKLSNKKPPYSKKKAVLKHFCMMRKHFKNDKVCMNYFKKHLAWYMKSLKNSAELRQKAVTVKSIDEMIDLINSLPENF